MNAIFPILACGSMNLGPGFAVFMFILAAIWFSGIVWSCLNLFWIITAKAGRYFTGTNIVFLLVYVIPVVFFFCGVGALDGSIPAIVICFPVFSFSHFIYLLYMRRKFRKQKKDGDRMI